MIHSFSFLKLYFPTNPKTPHLPPRIPKTHNNPLPSSKKCKIITHHIILIKNFCQNSINFRIVSLVTEIYEIYGICLYFYEGLSDQCFWGLLECLWGRGGVNERKDKKNN